MNNPTIEFTKQDYLIMEEIMKGIKEVERDSLSLNHLHFQHPSPFSICPEVNRKSMSKAKEQFDAVASLVDYFVSLFDDVDKECTYYYVKVLNCIQYYFYSLLLTSTL